MTFPMEDRQDDLAHMREQGIRCLQVAETKGDERGFLLWKQSVTAIESLLTQSRLQPPA